MKDLEKPRKPFSRWAARTVRRAWVTVQRRPRACGIPVLFAYLLGVLLLWKVRMQHASDKSNQSDRLIVMLPFTIAETRALLGNIESWARTGPACSNSAHVDLGLLFHATQETLPFDVESIRNRPELKPALDCFTTIHTLYAALTSEEDVYPAGPSVMFFRVYTDPVIKAQLSPYRAMFWMELDTFPVKPLWIDKLYTESLVGDFWMRGSIYFGPAFDETVKAAVNWDWVGHINGNALYRLNDAEFEYFLALVADVEPPKHYWKPFDISIWKVLHTFPYYWRIHQHVIKRFVYATYIQHWGFTITEGDINAARVADDVYLLHGKNTSAGIVKYKRKFVEGVPVEKKTINWDGSVDLQDDICVMIRSWRGDIPYVRVAIKSIHAHMPNARDIVMVVPDEDYATFQAQQRANNISKAVRLIREPRLIADDHVQQKYSKLMADTYCESKFIFHLDSDVVFMRKVYRKDLFFMGRPLLEYDRYENLPSTAMQWKLGTSFAVGAPVEHEFSRANNHMYPRAVYSAARKHIETRFGKSLPEFLATRVGRLGCPECVKDNVTALEQVFSDFNYIGAYLWFHMHDAMWWMPLDAKEGQGLYMRPIISPFVCQGNARLAEVFGKVDEDIETLTTAMNTGDCSSTIKLGVDMFKARDLYRQKRRQATMGKT
jgi:hypothetical protein